MLVKTSDDIKLYSRNVDELIIPLFVISARTGEGMEMLIEFLNQLPSQLYNNYNTYNISNEYYSSGDNKLNNNKENYVTNDDFLVFDIHEHFTTVDKKVVVAGFVNKGKLSLGCKYHLGPDKKGSYSVVEIEGLHCKKIPTKNATKGQFITICLKSKFLR